MINSFILNQIALRTGESEEELRIPFFEGIFNYITSAKFLRTIVVIAIGVIIWLVIRYISKKQVIKLAKGSLAQRNARIILNMSRAVLIFCMLIVILQVNGINVTSLVAGLGIVSVIVGFAFQDLLADWIKGISIMTEHFFNVGDVITVGELTGRVVNMNLKTTQLEDIRTGNVITMDNRLISQAAVVSKNLDIYPPIPYGKNSGDIDAFLEEVVKGIKEVDGVTQCVNKGLQRFDASQLTYLIRIVIDDPFKRLIITRAANNVILTTYEKWGWDIPFNQLDVHIKEN